MIMIRQRHQRSLFGSYSCSHHNNVSIVGYIQMSMMMIVLMSLSLQRCIVTDAFRSSAFIPRRQINPFVTRTKMDHRSVVTSLYNTGSNSSPSSQSSSVTTTTTTTNQDQVDDNDTNNLLDDELKKLQLTPELEKITRAFHQIGDDKLRYKQLLYMANQLKPMSSTSQIIENKVKGCLSTVYIDGTTTSMNDDENNETLLIDFVGDSDGVLTKGLTALLVRGLSGNTAQAIQAVDPTFIQYAGIQASLTPGRNNGFLNMLSFMKQKALQLEQEATKQQLEQQPKPKEEKEQETDNAVEENNVNSDRPIYQQMIQNLHLLQPNVIELEDVSYQHAGHSGNTNQSGFESHFDLYIVSDAFQDLSLVKRHQLIYMMLGTDIMQSIHALQIKAKTPKEI